MENRISPKYLFPFLLMITGCLGSGGGGGVDGGGSAPLTQPIIAPSPTPEASPSPSPSPLTSPTPDPATPTPTPSATPSPSPLPSPSPTPIVLAQPLSCWIDTGAPYCSGSIAGTNSVHIDLYTQFHQPFGYQFVVTNLEQDQDLTVCITVDEYWNHQFRRTEISCGNALALATNADSGITVYVLVTE